MSAVLGWLAVLGIFILSILIMLVLGYIVSSLFRRADYKDRHPDNKR